MQAAPAPSAFGTSPKFGEAEFGGGRIGHFGTRSRLMCVSLSLASLTPPVMGLVWGGGLFFEETMADIRKIKFETFWKKDEIYKGQQIWAMRSILLVPLYGVRTGMVGCVSVSLDDIHKYVDEYYRVKLN
jgi:hypothetical protein